MCCYAAGDRTTPVAEVADFDRKQQHLGGVGWERGLMRGWAGPELLPLPPEFPGELERPVLFLVQMVAYLGAQLVEDRHGVRSLVDGLEVAAGIEPAYRALQALA
jgi:hypothetical protein